VTWITVDVGLWKHPKMASLPNDTARYGWIVTLSEAKTQHPPGTFASVGHYKEVMGRFGRYLPDYLRAGLMESAAGATLVIHDWKKHQWTVQKRGQRADIERTFGGHSADKKRTYIDRDIDIDSKGSKEPSSLRASTGPTSIRDLLPGVKEALQS
jgi:hypothetical protein